MDREDYCIDHLHRFRDNFKAWVYRFEEDIQYVDKDQTIT